MKSKFLFFFLIIWLFHLANAFKQITLYQNNLDNKPIISPMIIPQQYKVNSNNFIPNNNNLILDGKNYYQNPNNYQIIDLTMNPKQTQVFSNEFQTEKEDKNDDLVNKVKKILQQIKNEKKEVKKEKSKLAKMKQEFVIQKDKPKENKYYVHENNLNEFIQDNKDKLFISHKIKVKNNTFYTNDTIENKETIISIPFSLIISRKTKNICEKIKPYFPQNQTIDQICISVYIMNGIAKNKKNNINNGSIYKYYSGVLKLKHFYSKFPIFHLHEPRIKKILRYTNFNNDLNSMYTQINNEFQILTKYKILPVLNSKITLANYIKIRMFVLDKTIQVDTNQTPMPILAPLIDSIPFTVQQNENLENVFFSYSNKNNEEFLVLKASRTINPKEQLQFKLINYSNKDLLIQTGRVIDKNEIRSNTTLIVKTVSNNATNSTIYINFNGKMKLNKVLSQIRGYSMDSKGGNFSEPTNIDVEIASLDLLKKILKTTISNYKTNYESDGVLLKYNKKLSRNEKNILMVLFEEKKLMNDYYKMVKLFEKMLITIKESKKTYQDLIRRLLSNKASKEYFIKLKNVITNLINNNQVTSAQGVSQNLDSNLNTLMQSNINQINTNNQLQQNNNLTSNNIPNGQNIITSNNILMNNNNNINNENTNLNINNNLNKGNNIVNNFMNNNNNNLDNLVNTNNNINNQISFNNDDQDDFD